MYYRIFKSPGVCFVPELDALIALLILPMDTLTECKMRYLIMNLNDERFNGAGSDGGTQSLSKEKEEENPKKTDLIVLKRLYRFCAIEI